MAKFYSVGVGAGDGSYITLGALRALEQALKNTEKNQLHLK